MIIAVTSQKGGSGKTTTSLCLADALRRKGKRVLLVDSDPQGSLAVWAEDAQTMNGHEYGLLIADGEVTDALITRSSEYDDTIIDCPPRLDALTRSALMVADIAVIPVRPSPGDLNVLGDTLNLIARAQDAKPDLRAVMLVSQRPPKSNVSDNAVEAMRATGMPVLDASFGFRVAYMEAHGLGVGPITLDPRSSAAKEVTGALKQILALMEQD